MILKIRDGDDKGGGAWVYFDRIERISVVPHGPLGEGEDQNYGGGTYTTLKKKFKVATMHRTWGHRAEVQFIEEDVAFYEGYLLGDDGQMIERL